MNRNDLYALMTLQYTDLQESLNKYLEELDVGNRWGTYGNKNYGKSVVKDKIIRLRQTLMRISEGLDKWQD